MKPKITKKEGDIQPISLMSLRSNTTPDCTTHSHNHSKVASNYTYMTRKRPLPLKKLKQEVGEE